MEYIQINKAYKILMTFLFLTKYIKNGIEITHSIIVNPLSTSRTSQSIPHGLFGFKTKIQKNNPNKIILINI